ncbi:MAG TPA: TIGR01777 family oxidoreductase, partial [Chryseolinea sp.]|nr:TIGR01777 family oxidoreductase [Chryseolinea sp.]
LTDVLVRRGYQVAHLERSRREHGSVKVYTWDIDKQYIEPGALENIGAIVHLAGAGIADKRWTKSRKNEILESRTRSTQLLHHELGRRKHQVRTFVCASAIGYYGIHCKDEIHTEQSEPGNDFLADVTKRWEREADAIKQLGIRVVKLRTGIVLSEKGGALAQMVRPIKFYVGAPLGSGDQYMSWVHIDDHCGLFVKAIEDTHWEGAYNSVAPAPVPVTNKEFTVSVGEVLKKPILLPCIPAFVLKLVLGEMSDIVLHGCYVSAEKVLGSGYEFKFTTLKDALQNVLIRK